jgi:cellulose synthase/poly-beta-1,6-N-acetylglucosamine synthase-like glycosyltransferase
MLVVLFLSSQLTVGICAYNEAKNIGNLLNSILNKQSLPADSEVLVVCSGCTDSTTEIVQGYAAQDPRVKMYVEEKRIGKSSAINYILANAKCDVILFVSADTLPINGSFNRLAKCLNKFNVGIVCGNPVPVNSPTSRVAEIVQLLWRFHSYVFQELNDSGLARHATEMFCIRKGIVDQIPNQTVNDDAYIAVTAKEKGWLIKFDSQSKVLICGPSTFREYFAQRRRILFGHYQIRKLTGKSPQYLMHMLPLHPLKTLKLVLWLFTNNKPVTTAIFLFTEFWVNLFSIADFIEGKSYFRWPALSSTKTAVTQPKNPTITVEAQT